MSRDNTLLSFRDAADHYAITIGRLKKWVKYKSLTAERDNFGILRITQKSIDQFDKVYAEMCPEWQERKKMLAARNLYTPKYELTDITTTTITGEILHRIRAKKDFLTTNNKNIKKGMLGGWIECYHNLSQEGNAWVGENGIVWGDARVTDNGYVGDNAEVTIAAQICDNAMAVENAQVTGHAYIHEQATIKGNSIISEHAIVKGKSIITDQVSIYGHAIIKGKSYIKNFAQITDYASILDVYVDSMDIIGGVETVTSDTNFKTESA